MKTLQQQETESILLMGQAHSDQREAIYRLGDQIIELQNQLALANDRIRQLESQIYGGK